MFHLKVNTKAFMLHVYPFIVVDVKFVQILNNELKFVINIAILGNSFYIKNSVTIMIIK